MLSATGKAIAVLCLGMAACQAHAGLTLSKGISNLLPPSHPRPVIIRSPGKTQMQVIYVSPPSGAAMTTITPAPVFTMTTPAQLTQRAPVAPAYGSVAP